MTGSRFAHRYNQYRGFSTPQDDKTDLRSGEMTECWDGMGS